ncbi:RICIN domain-containing protein [Streptomyces sp. NPDC049577]|uniref:RICIN domain-containing protein n=1 Tax=Streptomyces sp. NPDC049577 TaxID=3155153 RepID=UPI0034495314
MTQDIPQTQPADGVYAIAPPGEDLLTLPGEAPGSAVVVDRRRGRKGEQEWRVEASGDGLVTIRNVASGLYLGFEGEPAEDTRLAGIPGPVSWALRPSATQEGSYYIVAPGSELAVDLAKERVIPLLVALMPLDESNMRQAWQFWAGA